MKKCEYLVQMTIWRMGIACWIPKVTNTHSEYVILENCALLGYYAGNYCNFLPTFRDNLTVPPSSVKNPLSALQRFAARSRCTLLLPPAYYHERFKRRFFDRTSEVRTTPTMVLLILRNASVRHGEMWLMR